MCAQKLYKLYAMRVMLDLPDDLLEEIRTAARKVRMSRKAYMEKTIIDFMAQKGAIAATSEPKVVAQVAAPVYEPKKPQNTLTPKRLEIMNLKEEIGRLGNNAASILRKKQLQQKIKELEESE